MKLQGCRLEDSALHRPETIATLKSGDSSLSDELRDFPTLEIERQHFAILLRSRGQGQEHAVAAAQESAHAQHQNHGLGTEQLHRMDDSKQNTLRQCKVLDK